jgi:hypothetical protein
MPRETCTVTEGDILPMPIWGEQRVQHRRALSEVKKNRRVAVGPHVFRELGHNVVSGPGNAVD